MAGYTEEETAKLIDLLEEMIPQEQDKAVMEAACLLRAEQEWRDSGCPKGKPYRIGNPPRHLPASATRKHCRRF